MITSCVYFHLIQNLQQHMTWSEPVEMKYKLVGSLGQWQCYK